MIIDARSLPDNKTIETEVCIVGAGIAGITIAREFIDKDFKVCLLESGGLEPDRATQSLYWGENIGLPYYELDTARACCFGGSSHRWNIPLGDNTLGVRLRPLDEIDFEERDWIPYSGWPFDKSHLVAFYKRAQSVCKVGPFTYEVEDWENPDKTPRLPFITDRVKTAIFQFGPRDPFFKDYREEIEKAENISTFIFANAVEIETNDTAQTATRIHFSTINGRRFYVSAKLFILALGGIETPRLLLLSNKKIRFGLGNQNDLVGRFFMEHLHFWSGFYLPSRPDTYNHTTLYRIHKVNSIPIMGKLVLSDDVLRKERLANYCVTILPRVWVAKCDFNSAQSEGVKSLRAIRSAISSGHMPNNAVRHFRNMLDDIDSIAIAAYRKMIVGCTSFMNKGKRFVVYQLDNMTEQVPNPDSRVTLSEECDVLGRRRPKLDWQLSPLDIRSVMRAQEIMDEEFRLAGLGRLRIDLKDENELPVIVGGWHHMGTTRMHTDPRKGVVDENCRVHNMSNLYIAGPSVFPTGGYANPTLTVVALAIRLADHIMAKIE
ncbi:MAG: GMC oxidoreductase [Cytophagaceae bacterium]